MGHRSGVSSPERHEPPFPEMFEVPAVTARLVNKAHARGSGVIAVGTTVVRALESAATGDAAVDRAHTAATIEPARGFTSLVITPERPVRVVDSLITGWHEPDASHLRMLQALAGPQLIGHSYDEALRHGYLWHEFGDSHLLL